MITTIPNNSTVASLTVLGTDNNGRQLIYDPNLDVTWYDYAAPSTGWKGMNDWAAGLAVNFQGTSITGWELPSALVFTPPGSSTPLSAMEYLVSVELGIGTTFNAPPNVAPFQNLLPAWWSDPTNFQPVFKVPPPTAFWLSTKFGNTPFPYNLGYSYNFVTGRLEKYQNGESHVPYAIAFRAGQVIAAPSNAKIKIS